VTQRTPKALQKRKLTLREATEQWAETALAIEGLKMLQAEAGAVLLAHSEKTERRAYFDRVAVVRSGGSLVLDQAAVRDELPAERFVEGDLMRRSKLGWSLKLLK
jgi:hypothetical protein